MELYGIKLDNEPTIRQMEKLELAQKDAKSNVETLVNCIAILKAKDETKTEEQIKELVYDLKATEIKKLSDFIETIAIEDKKK